MSLRPLAHVQTVIARVARLAANAAGWIQSGRRSRPRDAERLVLATPPFGCPGLTLATYDELTEGLSPDAVATLVGRQGTLLNQNVAEGISTATYEWRTEDGQGRLYVVFQASRLVSMSQDGLR
jgi:hypothetical protein